MHLPPSLALLLCVGLSGCFLSAGAEVAECTEAPSCTGGRASCLPASPGCELSIVCGEMLYCALTEQCAAIPTCAPEEIEVPSCEPSSVSCHTVDECGSTIFCDFCDPGDVCEGDILREEPCDDEGPACRIVGACGEQFICQVRPSECDEPNQCPPDMMQVGHCEISEGGCYVLPGCNEEIYCVPAMGECSSGVQVSGPEECDPDRSCFFEDDGDRRVWCTGGGPNCFAFPVCESHEHMIELLDPCPGTSQCRYETLCGLTVQCSAPSDVDG